MKLGDVRESENVEDRRNAGGGFGRRGPIAISGVTVVAALVVALITGKNPLELLSGAGNARGPRTHKPVDANDPGAVFVRKVLATTEDCWNDALPKMGVPYKEPTLVLFRDGVDSACGFQDAAVGPFYCPGDSHAYVDLDFLDDLQKKLGAQGEFASGYVIAHEVGHHVQNLLGDSKRARGDKDKGPTGASVRLELQADCYAGVWASWVKKKGLLEVGDVQQALDAANAIGDDTLQRRAGKRVTPESFSHGSGEQRVRWFSRGMDSGDPRACDTFAASAL